MKKQVILMSLAIAGLLCCIPMFVLNAPGAPGLSGGAASCWVWPGRCCSAPAPGRCSS
ncbi:MAG: hypothetical protein ACLTYN_13270 [Dysosmobacter welbionis]